MFLSFLYIPGTALAGHNEKDTMFSETCRLAGEIDTEAISNGHVGAGPESCAGHYGSTIQRAT